MLTDYADPQPANEDGGYLVPRTMVNYKPRPGQLARLARCLACGSPWRYATLTRLGWDRVVVDLYEMLLSKTWRSPFRGIADLDMRDQHAR
jgi:hypothetical protein